ncbi:MAG: type I DNA topoisomerase [Bacteriovoracaceae bacterium]|nr:type I DNA topoisomerase [Bacteriovoracaceae bacterium]
MSQQEAANIEKEPKAKAQKKPAVKKKAKTTKKSSAKKREQGPYSLVIVESPSKAKTIKKYLGKGFQVVASNGHIKDLPKSKLGVDVKSNFTVDLVPISGKKDKIERIKELAKGADKIYLAPDPDREGEAIAFHLCEEIGKKKEIFRVLFNAVTKTAVKAAIETPTALDVYKYDSQKTRRVLDRLVGYKISPILWEKVQRGLSAGRVQSVALRIIVEREEKILAFTPEQWFSIHAKFIKDGTEFEARYYGEELTNKKDLLDEKVVSQILNDIKGAGNQFKTVEVRRRERKQSPTPPFTTSKLQQEAANKLGFTAKKTMRLAQNLYEGVQLSDHGLQGLITYMRTDSVRTDQEAMSNLQEYIKQEYGEDYLAHGPIVYKKKGSAKVQDAHEAIRPTNMKFTPEAVKGDLEADELKLYTIIWNKFVSSQMSKAIIDQTTLNFEVAGHYFRANGSVIKFAGFRTVYMESLAEKVSKKGEEEEEGKLTSKGALLPKVEVEEVLTPQSDPGSIEHWTSPPPRYSEATLVKELEEEGIGRPSTYAAIISNIQDRGYVDKKENRFVPNELGIVICRMLIESFPEIMDIEFTAKVEAKLDMIEVGEIKWKKVLKDFWKPFEKTLEKAKEEMKNLKKQLIPTGVKCRKCEGGEYFIKWGRNGQFLACSNYPECTSTEDFVKHLDGSYEIIPKTYSKEKCPECNKRMIVKKGRFGRFLACEEYPNCKTAMPYVLEVNCPECKKGRFAEKKSRYGKIFYGCTNYPDCKNAMWTTPRNFDCVSCGYPVMVDRMTKREGRQLQCPKCKHKVDWDSTPFAKLEQT